MQGLQTPAAKAVREHTGLPQSEFARMMRVSVKTLQNWEQHRRNPTGPAAAMLKIVVTAPDVAWKSLHARLFGLMTYCAANVPRPVCPSGLSRSAFPQPVRLVDGFRNPAL